MKITGETIIKGLLYLILKGKEGGKYLSRKKVVDPKTGKMRWGGYVYNNPKKIKQSHPKSDNKSMDDSFKEHEKANYLIDSYIKDYLDKDEDPPSEVLDELNDQLIQNFSITFDSDKDEDIKNLKDSYQYLSNNEIEYYYELNRHELKSIPSKRDTLFIIDYINLNKILDNKNKELENESKQKAQTLKLLDSDIKTYIEQFEDDDFLWKEGYVGEGSSLYININNENETKIRISDHANLSNKHKSPDYSLVLSDEDLWDTGMNRPEKFKDIQDSEQFNDRNKLLERLKEIIQEEIGKQ